MYKATLFALCLLFSPLSVLAQSPYPSVMGSICKKGETLFYGQMTKTNSEEKLCEDTDGNWYFWVKDGNSSQVIGTKVTGVEKINAHGNIGYTSGYKFPLEGDVVQLVATFKGKEKVLPMNGFIIIGDYPVPLKPLSIIIKH